MDKIIEIFDSTLREGAKGVDVSFSIDDKIQIIRILDQLGVSYIEAGNPSQNTNDIELFKAVKDIGLESAKIVAYGKTRKPNTSINDDKNCKILLEAQTDVVSISGKAWDLEIRGNLKISLEENLKMITETVQFFKRHGKMVFFQAEHFFDGFKSNHSYAMQVLKSANEAGADRMILCDTYGGNFPHDIFEFTDIASDAYPSKIGVNIYDDVGCSVANTVVAVRAGATLVQGTYLGMGKRCGNTSLATLIPNLQLKLGFVCIPVSKMKDIYKTAAAIADIANIKIQSTMPYVGRGAFVSKGDLNFSDVYKTDISYEHVLPEMVGNRRSFLVSELTARPTVLSIIGNIDKEMLRDKEIISSIIYRVKEMEESGYQFSAAMASLELFILKQLGKHEPLFEVLNFRIIEEQLTQFNGDTASAMTKIKVGDKTEITASEGNGPIHAMDISIRKALEVFYPNIKTMKLIDYNVKVIDYSAATTAAVRVVIESTDGESTWSTIGVSTDVIHASWQALNDSIEYKLLKDKLFI